MRSTPLTTQAGSEDSYQHVQVVLAQTYDMSQFSTDLASQNPLYGFHVWGPCPRCGHLSSGLIPVEFLVVSPGGQKEVGRNAAHTLGDSGGLALSYRLTPSELPAPRPVQEGFSLKAAALTCHCLVAHDQVHGNTGCGAEWMIAFEYARDPGTRSGERGVTLSSVPPDVAARIWVAADSVTDSVASAGKTAMTLAGKWITILTSVVGVIALGGVIAGRATILSIPPWPRAVLGTAALIAVIANALMIYQGNQAGTGLPVLRRARDERSLIDADIKPLRDASAAIDGLRKARNFAVLTVSAALIAVGLFLFWPAAASDHVKLKYTDTSGIVHQTGCGKLMPGSGKPRSFRPDTGPEVSLAGVTGLEIDAC